MTLTHRRPSIADKRAAFRQLHTSGCFVIPNPWDIGSARYLETLGFKALASTSSGFAWSRGLADNRSSRTSPSSRQPWTCRSTPISRMGSAPMRRG
jgi:phosphoenolpyruvate phosphomutase-like protein